MDLGLRRWRLARQGLFLAGPVGMAGLVFVAAPATLLLVITSDPEENVINLLMLLSAAIPAALAVLWGAGKAFSLNGRTPCSQCGSPLRACVCCAACEGAGRSRSANWLMPNACIACLGAGNTRPDMQLPVATMGGAGKDFCCICGKQQYGKRVGIASVSKGFSDWHMKDLYTRVDQYSVRLLNSHLVFLCIDCGRTCKDEHSAERQAAHLLTRALRQHGRRLDEAAPRGFGQEEYWSATDWRNAPRQRA